WDRAREGRRPRLRKHLRRPGGRAGLRRARPGRDHRRHARAHDEGAGASVQPRVLHVGRAARGHPRRVRRAQAPIVLATDARRDPRMGRRHRRVQREDGSAGRAVSAMPSSLACSGCGWAPPDDDPYPFRCANAGSGDDVDHVIVRTLDASKLSWPTGTESNTFVRYRELFRSHHLATSRGMPDAEYVELVERLDKEVSAVDGTGFVVTRFGRQDALSERLGFSTDGGVWVKDETRNVSGSHKARHLMGLAIWLEVVETLGYELASQLAHEGTVLGAVFVQVGGGALASSVIGGLRDAGRLGAIRAVPQLFAVQTEGGHPLQRAYDRMKARIVDRLMTLGLARNERDPNPIADRIDRPEVQDELAYARANRSMFMWPWEEEPKSIAHGILDDETYDGD